MLRRIVFLLIIPIFISSFYHKAFAVRELSFTSNKNSLFNEDIMLLTASHSGFSTGETVYIKGAFYLDGSSNYFGFTKNGDTWIKNSQSFSSQRQIKIGEWDGGVEVKSDFSDSGFKGNGQYKFKLGYYYITSGGNTSSVNWSNNSIDILLTAPTFSPTPQATSTPLPTSTKTPTKVYSSPTPTLVIVQEFTKSPTVNNKPTLHFKNTKKQQVLSSKTTKKITLSPTIFIDKKPEKGLILPPVLIILSIFLIITGCGILLFRELKREKELDI